MQLWFSLVSCIPWTLILASVPATSRLTSFTLRLAATLRGQRYWCGCLYGNADGWGVARDRAAVEYVLNNRSALNHFAQQR